MALPLNATALTARFEELRDGEPDPFQATPEEVEAYVLDVGELIRAFDQVGEPLLTEPQRHFLDGAAGRQVRFARARLDDDRHNALETLSRLFRLGRPAQPDGRFEGELVALSTGLLADPFFEWLTRIYLPWLGKTFDAAASTGVQWALHTRSSWIVLHSDLPLVGPSDIEALAGPVGEGGSVIAPSADGGTSAIGSEAAVRFSFGASSFHRHLLRITTPRVVARTGLLLDIDSPRDLAAAMATGRGAWLEEALR